MVGISKDAIQFSDQMKPTGVMPGSDKKMYEAGTFQGDKVILVTAKPNPQVTDLTDEEDVFVYDWMAQRIASSRSR
jgi:hypothetical protein